MALGKCRSPFSYLLFSVSETNLDLLSILDESPGHKPRLSLGHFKGAVANLGQWCEIIVSSDRVTPYTVQISRVRRLLRFSTLVLPGICILQTDRLFPLKLGYWGTTYTGVLRRGSSGGRKCCIDVQSEGYLAPKRFFSQFFRTSCDFGLIGQTIPIYDIPRDWLLCWLKNILYEAQVKEIVSAVSTSSLVYSCENNH